MLFPVACIKTKTKCTCYTDQATPIRGLDDGLCIDYAENGIYNPYKTAEQLQSEPTETTEVVQSAPQVAQMGGQPLPSLGKGNSPVVANIQ